jgi:hypothetical protein
MRPPGGVLGVIALAICVWLVYFVIVVADKLSVFPF